MQNINENKARNINDVFQHWYIQKNAVFTMKK